MDRNSKEYTGLATERRFRQNLGEEDYREFKWAEDILQKINKQGFTYYQDFYDLDKARDIGQRLQYKYAKKPSLGETRENHTTAHYIWRTQDDDKVRSRHAEFDDKIFSWNEPPAGGKHPGEDYGCRCWSEAYNPKSNELSEHVTQIVTAQGKDDQPAWEWEDFLCHYFTAEGDSVILSEIGHLASVIECAKNYEQSKLEGRGTIFQRVEKDICTKAIQHGVGNFSYSFHRAYDFQEYVYSIGDATLWGNGEVNVEEVGEYLVITSEISYNFYDIFTDVFSIGELSNSLRKRIEEYMKVSIGKENQNIIGEYDIPLVSYPYQILGGWNTHFEAVIKKNN